MANDFTKRPMEVDTAAAITTTHNIRQFEWHPAAEDNDLEIQDTAGNVLWRVRAQFACANHEAANILYRDVDSRAIVGINVVTIDGGILYIHIGTRYVDQH